MNEHHYNVSGTVGDGAAFGQFAKGGDVYKTGVSEETDKVQLLLDELTQQIRDHQDELAQLKGLTESVQMIRDELAQPEPRRFSIKMMLENIAASAGGVTAVADAALKVAQLFK